MLRFIFTITANMYRAPYLIPKMNYQAAHPEIYSEQERYDLVRHTVECLKNKGRIKTKCFGLENLPKEGGYIMYPNHQGKYDVLGIIHTHEKPCTFVMDEAKSYRFYVKQVVNLIQGKRLKKDDIRQSLQIINEVAEEAAEGRRFVLFPEGGYEDNSNDIYEFKSGSFKSAMKAKVPIVPVALIDSYRVFSEWSLKRLETQVHYLKPLLYKDYTGMKSNEIAALVRERIEKVVKEYSRN